MRDTDIPCASPECPTPILFSASRFCNGCYADAAKDMARQIESVLIRDRGLRPGSFELRRTLPHAPRTWPLDWFEASSPLGKLTPSEAVYLRTLTGSACNLVAQGGVAALRNLPGTRREDAPQQRRGTCNLRDLPQAAETEPQPRPVDGYWTERKFQLAVACFLFAVLVALTVTR